MPKKFKKGPFRDWLDCLARIVVKTDDNFTCQIQQSPNCAGQMMPLDRNCQWCHIKSRSRNDLRWSLWNAMTGCGQCHQWAHANPDEFGKWYADNYPHRWRVLKEMSVYPLHTWRESEYKYVELELLESAEEVGVDYLNVPVKYRMRLKRKLEELKG